MNEKIKLLAEQAREWVNDANNVILGADFNLYGDAYNKKFAELLIKEALYVVDIPRHERNMIREAFDMKEETDPPRDIGLVSTRDWTK